MDYCTCCGKPLSCEGSQVCYNCLQISKEDRPKLLRITIDDLNTEKRQLKHRLFELTQTIKSLERAERRTQQ